MDGGATDVGADFGCVRKIIEPDDRDPFAVSIGTEADFIASSSGSGKIPKPSDTAVATMIVTATEVGAGPVGGAGGRPQEHRLQHTHIIERRHHAVQQPQGHQPEQGQAAFVGLVERLHEHVKLAEESGERRHTDEGEHQQQDADRQAGQRAARPFRSAISSLPLSRTSQAASANAPRLLKA